MDILVLTRGQRAHAAGGLCNAHSWSDVEMRDLAKSRPDSSRASASLSVASFYFLPAWLPRMSTSRVLSIQESAQHVLERGGVLVLLPSRVVGDQLNWANPESSMAQLDQGSLDHHLVLIPLIEAIVRF